MVITSITNNTIISNISFIKRLVKFVQRSKENIPKIIRNYNYIKKKVCCLTLATHLIKFSIIQYQLTELV